MEQERNRTVFHNGKYINYFDYRGLETEEAILAAIRETRRFLEEQNRQTLQLTNVTGVYFTRGVIKPALEEIERCKPFVLKDAMVGITGAKRILFQTYLTIFPGKTRSFTDENAALEWLTGE